MLPRGPGPGDASGPAAGPPHPGGGRPGAQGPDDAASRRREIGPAAGAPLRGGGRPGAQGPDDAASRRREIGPYGLVRELGRGGMGVVWEARDPTTGRALALKEVLGAGLDPEVLARFGREAELLARVRHPGVLAVHALGRAERGPYLVTELVAGRDLEVLRAAGPLGPRRAAEVARALADAVEAVHAAGVLHRDVKPKNVLVRDDDGRPVLLDFGLARELDGATLTRSGTVVGTPAYMAPEQADGPRGLDARADVYGLGAVLFFLLAGRAPYEGSLTEVLTRLLTRDPRWPEEAPAELLAVVRRAMARDRAGRYPSAAALRDDLDRWLAGARPLAAGPARRPGRRAALALGVAAALALAAAAGRWAWLEGKRRGGPPRGGPPPGGEPAPGGEPPPGGEPADPAAALAALRRARAPLERLRLAERWLTRWPQDARADECRAVLRALAGAGPLAVVPPPARLPGEGVVGLARAVFTGPRRLAIAYEHTPRVHVVDLGADGPPTPQRLFEAAHAPGLGSAVRALAAVWAPDGRCAGLLAGGDGQAVDWVDPATGRPLAPPWRVPATPSTRDPVTGAPTFATPDILALAAVTSGARTTVLVGGGWDHAWLLEVSPDGGWRQVGAGLGDLPTPFSDAAPAPQAGRFAYVCSLGGTAFSGERMEDAAGYFQVREVDARPGQPVAPAATAFDGAPRPRCVAYAPDGSLVVGRDGGAVLARVGGAIVEVFRADVMGERDVADLTFARDGRRLWVTATHGWKDGQPRDRTGASVFGLRWPPGEAGCEVLQRHDDLPLTLSLDVAPDGALVAVGCVDGSVQVFVVGAP